MYISLKPFTKPDGIPQDIPTKDTHYYRYNLDGRYLPYRPPRPAYCDLHPDAIAFYEEWVEYKREVKVERSTAWYTWLTFGMLQETTTKVIITEVYWRLDHYCNGSVSEPYVVESVSYVDDQSTGFAFVWDTLIGDDPNRRVGPRLKTYLAVPEILSGDDKPSQPFSPPNGEVIDDDYVARLKEQQEEEGNSPIVDQIVKEDVPAFFKEDILVRINLAGEGYVRIIGSAKNRSKPIILREGSTIDGADLPYEFFDSASGIINRKFVVEYVGTTPAERYGDDVLLLTIKIRETM